MYVVLHYIGPAENDLKYQYTVTVMNDEVTESVIVTHMARRFTETEDDIFIPKDCLKLHCDYTDRFRDEQGWLTVSVEIFRVNK